MGAYRQTSLTFPDQYMPAAYQYTNFISAGCNWSGDITISTGM